MVREGGERSITTEFGKRLLKARKKANLTQDSLAKMLGISFQQVQKYEGGANRISAARLWVIADVLKVPISYFFDGLEQVEPGVVGTIKQPELLTHDIIKIAHILENVPEGEIKDKIFLLIKALAKEFRDKE